MSDRIFLIGPFPPPLGGISVLLKRRKRALEAEGHRVVALDVVRVGRLATLAALCGARLRRYARIDVHLFSLPILLTLAALGLAGRTRLVDHGDPLERWSPVRRRLLGFFLRRCGALVLDGGHLERRYAPLGLPLPARTVVEHPMIPPPLDEEDAIVRSYPPEVHAFIAARRPLVIANGFHAVVEDGVDVYGLDMSVELIAALRNRRPNVGLLFALAETGDAPYLERIRTRIAALGLGEHVLFMIGQQEIWPLFKRAALMVRPTSRDGFGISVAEALHFGCPAVASDVSDRAAGAVLFARRDLADFIAKAEGVL